MSPTPAGVTITATKPDGTTEDITEGVQALYDLVIGSMDWGSSFLSVEDAEPVAALAQFCGFKGWEEAPQYLESERKAEQQRLCPHPNWERQSADERGVVYGVCLACGLKRYVTHD